MAQTDVIAAARGWIGTPYRHQQSAKGAGCDCIGLVRGVWREVIGPEPERAPPYSADWGDASGAETLLLTLEKYLIPVEMIDSRPGDVIALRWRPTLVAKHCLILSDENKAIHAIQGSPVSEFWLSRTWRQKFTAAFRFPEQR